MNELRLITAKTIYDFALTPVVELQFLVKCCTLACPVLVPFNKYELYGYFVEARASQKAVRQTNNPVTVNLKPSKA